MRAGQLTYIIIPKSRHSRIVGHGGSTVTRIQGAHGVRIVVPKRSDLSAIVTICGAADAVANAKAAIELVTGVRAGDPATDPMVRFRVPVSVARRGAVIGRGGDVKRAIEEECGVLLHIPHRDDMEPSVTLEGTAAACAAARARIEAVVGDSSNASAALPAASPSAVAPRAASPLSLVDELLATVARARAEGFVDAAARMPGRVAIEQTFAQLLASGQSPDFVRCEFANHLAAAKAHFADAAAAARPPAPSQPPREAPAAFAAEHAPFGVRVSLDGPNLAMAHGLGQRRSIMGIDIAVAYFRGLEGVAEVVAFVPKHWANDVGGGARREGAVDGAPLLRAMIENGTVVATPSQADDDVFFVEWARRRGWDGFVVSNDMLRDHIERARAQTAGGGARGGAHGAAPRPALSTWTRSQLVNYTFVGDEFLPNVSAGLFRRLDALCAELRAEEEDAMEL